ncbi:MAG: hypothetical protein R3F43_09905 [bacterium]
MRGAVVWLALGLALGLALPACEESAPDDVDPMAPAAPGPTAARAPTPDRRRRRQRQPTFGSRRAPMGPGRGCVPFEGAVADLARQPVRRLPCGAAPQLGLALTGPGAYDRLSARRASASPAAPSSSRRSPRPASRRQARPGPGGGQPDALGAPCTLRSWPASPPGSRWAPSDAAACGGLPPTDVGSVTLAGVRPASAWPHGGGHRHRPRRRRRPRPARRGWSTTWLACTDAEAALGIGVGDTTIRARVDGVESALGRPDHSPPACPRQPSAATSCPCCGPVRHRRLPRRWRRARRPALRSRRRPGLGEAPRRSGVPDRRPPASADAPGGQLPDREDPALHLRLAAACPSASPLAAADAALLVR